MGRGVFKSCSSFFTFLNLHILPPCFTHSCRISPQRGEPAGKPLPPCRVSGTPTGGLRPVGPALRRKFWLVSFKPCPQVLPRASLGLHLQQAPHSTRRIPTNGETCRAGKSAIFMYKAMPNEFALFCPFCVFHPGTQSTRNARKQRTPAINRPPRVFPSRRARAGETMR